jgi:hypothetical protein
VLLPADQAGVPTISHYHWHVPSSDRWCAGGSRIWFVLWNEDQRHEKKMSYHITLSMHVMFIFLCILFFLDRGGGIIG